jgi:hypothetical protein
MDKLYGKNQKDSQKISGKLLFAENVAISTLFGSI